MSGEDLIDVLAIKIFPPITQASSNILLIFIFIGMFTSWIIYHNGYYGVLFLCMTLPKEAIEEFKQIYKKEAGVDLTDAEAFDKANRLFNFMKVITKSIKQKEPDDNARKG